jgi:hypothetical protein
LLTIVDVEWRAGPLSAGAALPVRVRVKNVGASRVETPPVGGQPQSFLQTLESNRALPDSGWSVGLRAVDGRQTTNREFWRPGGRGESGTDAPLAQYPVRLALREPLDPGQEVDLMGELPLPSEPGYYALSAGLIQDSYRLVEDDRARQIVEVGR